MPHTHASERLRLYECECKQIIRGRQFRLHRRSTGHIEVSRLDLCLHCMQYALNGQKQSEFISRHSLCPLKPPNKEAYFTLWNSKMAGIASSNSMLTPTMCSSSNSSYSQARVSKSDLVTMRTSVAWNSTSAVSTAPDLPVTSYIPSQRLKVTSKEKDAYLALWKSKMMASASGKESNSVPVTQCSLPNCSQVFTNCVPQGLTLTAIPPAVTPAHQPVVNHQQTLSNHWVYPSAQRPVTSPAAAWFLPGGQCSIPIITKAFSTSHFQVKTEIKEEVLPNNI